MPGDQRGRVQRRNLVQRQASPVTGGLVAQHIEWRRVQAKRFGGLAGAQRGAAPDQIGARKKLREGLRLRQGLRLQRFVAGKARAAQRLGRAAGHQDQA